MTLQTKNTVVTFANIASTAKDPAVTAGYALAGGGSHILLTVEDHLRNSGHFAGPGFITLQGAQDKSRPGTMGRCSIHLDRHRYRVVKHGVVLLNRANGMKFPGAERWGHTAYVQDMWTGRFIDVGSFHLVPHADNDNKPGVITDSPRGEANVKPAIASIIRALPNHRGFELGGMDANIDLDSDLRIHDDGMVERLRKAGLTTDVQALGPVEDTHGTQEYDWLFGRFPGGVKWVSHSTLPKVAGLDHRARRATISSTVLKGWKVPPAYAHH